MYNQFLSRDSFVPLPEEEDHASDVSRDTSSREGGQSASARLPHSDLLGDVTGSLRDLLGGVVKQFSLEKFDAGDILLVLILLFLFLEGDNLELVITLGLMLLLGLGED